MVDVEWFEKGYTAIHKHKITTLTDSHQGIDHIFWNPNTQKYAIVETKYNGTNMITLNDGTRQISDSWIDNGLANSRLKVALGNDSLYDQVKNNYERVVAYVYPNGKTVYKYVDESGYPINHYYPEL